MSIIASATPRVLEGELAKTDDHEAAFRIYDRIMRPFVEEGQGKGQGPN